MAVGDLADLIGRLVPKGARVLRIGNPSAGTERNLRPALNNLQASETVVAGDAFNVPLPFGMDLAIVALPVAVTPDVMEDLIYARVAPALHDGGVALVQFCRDASDASLDAMHFAPIARETLQTFLTGTFGARKIDSLAPIVDRFAHDGMFDCVGWAPRTRSDARDEPVVWLLLRRRPGGDNAHRAIARCRRSDRYPIDELAPFFGALKDKGVVFSSADRFAERMRAGATPGLVKFDLHRNIARPPEISRTMHDAGIPALFLMMHRHPFNEAFFDASEAWDVLKRIRDDGHEVGLHLDPVHLIRTYGDLYEGVEAALADFSKHGFPIRAATLHGDTSARIVARGLKAWDFFAEDAERSIWDRLPPEGNEVLANHVGRYSYSALQHKFGINDLVEAHYRHKGELISPDALLYLTDNSRSLQLTNIPAGGGTRAVVADVPFRLPAEFAAEIGPMLAGQPFLALFHPQWFW